MLNPLLAGPLSGWGRWLDRAAALGFTHVLTAHSRSRGRPCCCRRISTACIRRWARSGSAEDALRAFRGGLPGAWADPPAGRLPVPGRGGRQRRPKPSGPVPRRRGRSRCSTRAATARRRTPRRRAGVTRPRRSAPSGRSGSRSGRMPASPGSAWTFRAFPRRRCRASSAGCDRISRQLCWLGRRASRARP